MSLSYWLFENRTDSNKRSGPVLVQHFIVHSLSESPKKLRKFLDHHPTAMIRLVITGTIRSGFEMNHLNLLQSF